ncbi:MAG: translation elongation factor Ts [Planctomycetota bacterium]
MSISAKQVMALRQKTGLSMMECKKALTETGGDEQAAIDFLQKKLKGKMETRTDRAAGEGRVAVAVGDGAAAIVELAAETDFTAKNDAFVNATAQLAELALAAGSGDIDPTDDMKKLVDELRISTGENISIRRAAKVDGSGGARFGTYVHHDGKTGVLVHAEGAIDDETLKEVCLHITAAQPRPQGVTRDDVPAEVIERERRLAKEMAMEQGKPEEIAEKMVEGKVNKLYAELALVEQPWIKDDSKSIGDLIGGATIAGFWRWGVGETAPEPAAVEG